MVRTWRVGGPGSDACGRRIRRAVVRELPGLDAVAEVVPRGVHVLVAAAFDRLRRWGERYGLDAREWVGHRDVEDRDGAEEDALVARLLARVVVLFDGDRGKGLDRGLALAYTAVRAGKARS